MNSSPKLNDVELTTEQTKIVYCDSRVILASACPGSGKSTTLAVRARRLWETYGEPILVCTFSQDSAQDIALKIGGDPGQIKVCTIHKLGYDLVRENWSLVRMLFGNADWPLEAQLTSKEEELKIIGDWLKAGEPNRFYARVEALRSYGLHPSTLQSLLRRGVYFTSVSDKEVESWKLYEAHRLSCGLLSFSDMVDLARSIMTFPEVSSKFLRRYSHLLLDEAQDTSTGQWDLLRPLVNSCRTTLIVFDMNQAVYNWRGGDVGPLTALGYLDDAVCFTLSKSFRSGEEIGDFANKVVVDKRSQIQTQWSGAELNFKQFEEQPAEVDWVLEHADEQSAIVSRTNSYLEMFERRLLVARIPYTGTSFYRARHIQQLATVLQEYKTDNWRSMLQRAYMENSVYTAAQRLDFRRALKIMNEESPELFLEYTRQAAQQEEGRLTLTTGHASKGLEWDKVFVVGAHDGHVPHKLSNDEVEEQNLFYVMCTRARRELNISYCGRPTYFIPREYLNVN
jgi:DNA helicase-2/ATP-dependent DNA helicase PcrA